MPKRRRRSISSDTCHSGNGKKQPSAALLAAVCPARAPNTWQASHEHISSQPICTVRSPRYLPSRVKTCEGPNLRERAVFWKLADNAICYPGQIEENFALRAPPFPKSFFLNGNFDKPRFVTSTKRKMGGFNSRAFFCGYIFG